MNMPEAKSKPAPEIAMGGCCGPDSQHDHKEPSHRRQSHRDHDCGDTSKTTEAPTPVENPKAGHRPGCCCS
jgi:hypothetical protein